jgi:hypothetical protein
MPITLADLSQFTIRRKELRDRTLVLHGEVTKVGQLHPGLAQVHLGAEETVRGSFKLADQGGLGEFETYNTEIHPALHEQPVPDLR